MSWIREYKNIKFFIFVICYIHTLDAIGKEGYCSKNTEYVQMPSTEKITYQNNSTKNSCCSVKTTNGTGTVEKTYCCRHYERQNNECKECKVGFTTKNWQPCHQCEDGLYGKRCASICFCHDSERCHYIAGCINVQQKNTEEVSELTVPVKYTSTVAEHNVRWQITSLSPTIKLFTFRGKDTTVRVSARKITSTTEKPKVHNLGLNNREIIVYSVCAGSFLFVILLCTVCQRRYKKIYGNLRRYQVKRSRNVPEISLPAIPLNGSGGIYEVIDESSMVDNHENVRNIICSFTEVNERLSQLEISDYLTPYYAADEDSNTCNLCDNTSIASVSSNFNQHTTADRQSISSISNLQRSGSTYPNWYPPIVIPTDIETHGYAFISYPNDTDPSEAEEPSRESCVFNPYQSMVPDTDLHEYKSVDGCADALGSSFEDTFTTELRANPNQDRKSYINKHENKSVNDTLSDTVLPNLDLISDDSFEKIETKNEENLSYVD